MDNPDAETEFCAKRATLSFNLRETSPNFLTYTCIKAIIYRPIPQFETSTLESTNLKQFKVFDYDCNPYTSFDFSTLAAKIKTVKSCAERNDA